VIPAFARAAQTVSDQGSDSPHLVGLVEQIANNLAAPPEQISADAGYCSEDNLAALETRGIDAYVATGRRKHGAAAPAARPAKPESRVAAMAEKLGSAGHQGPYRLRKQVVEPVFGQIEQSARFSPIHAAWPGPGAERMVADPHRPQPAQTRRSARAATYDDCGGIGYLKYAKPADPRPADPARPAAASAAAPK
jgi:Transposase DDE domain